MYFEKNPLWILCQLKDISESWIKWRNFDKQLIRLLEYVKLQNVTPDTVDSIISKAMNITPAEETILKGLCESGVDVTIQMVPEDSPVNVEKVL